MSKSASELPSGKKIILRAEMIAASDEKADTIANLLTTIKKNALATEPGTLTFRLCRFGRSLLAFEEYADLEAFSIHNNSEHVKALFKAAPELIAAPPDISFYSEYANEGAKL
ncbi:hypothetical protein FRB94_005052 [Tulasnella sp. JGI-2019a]|nr:hypothetical protein FRB94_005052 [Tulasnella sp. JGI-2019a]KAG9021164.1 hypothetical protein FRB95_002727 [Tulasnella sp. JGI-2019a]